MDSLWAEQFNSLQMNKDNNRQKDNFMVKMKVYRLSVSNNK